MDYVRLKESVRDLENRVLRSEMRRQELEQQFDLLMRDRTKCELASSSSSLAIKSLKHRCELPLASRNRGLLQMLERIDYQAATLAAKTEQLKLLKTQHELNLMTKWSANQQANISRYSTDVQANIAASVPRFEMSVSSSQSEFVRYVRNANQPERHVMFADEFNEPRPAVLRPPMDYLTYAGKRWILDPTQFVEPLVQAQPVIRDRDIVEKLQRPSEYSFDSERQSKRHELIASMQTVEPLLRHRYSRQEEMVPGTPMRATVYPKYETYLTSNEVRLEDESEDDPETNADNVPVKMNNLESMAGAAKNARFENIVEKVKNDPVIIEDVIDPPENTEKVTEADEQVPEKLQSNNNIDSIEDSLYGEKISDNFNEHVRPSKMMPSEVSGNAEPQISENYNESETYPIELEEYNYQVNEPVYADAEYSKQYDYQVYDPNPIINSNDVEQTAYPSASVTNYAPQYEQQSQPDQSYNTDQNAIDYPAEQLAPAPNANTVDHDQQPQHQLTNEQQEHQFVKDRQQYTQPEYDQHQQQLPIESDQYAQQEYDQQQQPQPDQRYAGNDTQYAQQEYDHHQQQQQPQPLTDQQYGGDDAQYAQQQEYEQQQEQPPTSQTDQQYAPEEYDQQQPIDSQPEPQYTDESNYYAQQPADDGQTAYDPNAEYQVAQDVVADQPPAQDTYYAEVQPAEHPPVQQQPLVGEDQYYTDAPQYQTPESQIDPVAVSLEAQPQPLEEPASTALGAPELAAVNYVTSETESLSNSAAAPIDPDPAISGPNTESDFDFSVK